MGLVWTDAAAMDDLRSALATRPKISWVQLAQARQDQRERMLSDRLGERSLGRGPPPLPVDDPGLERSFHAGLGQLDPGDVRPGGQRGA